MSLVSDNVGRWKFVVVLTLVLSLLVVSGAGNGAFAQELDSTPTSTAGSVAETNLPVLPPSDQTTDVPATDSELADTGDPAGEPPAGKPTEVTDPVESETPETADPADLPTEEAVQSPPAVSPELTEGETQETTDPATPDDEAIDAAAEGELGSAVISFTTNDGEPLPDGARGCIHDYETDQAQCQDVAGTTLTFTDLEAGYYYVEFLTPEGGPFYTAGFGNYSPSFVDPVQIVGGQITELQVDLIAPGRVTVFVSGPGADTTHVCIANDNFCADVSGGAAVFSNVPAGSWTYNVYDFFYNNVIVTGEYELASGQNLEISVEVDLPEPGQVTFIVSGPRVDTAYVCTAGLCADVFEGAVVFSAVPAGSWTYEVRDSISANVIASGEYELAAGQDLEIDVETQEPGSAVIAFTTSDGGALPEGARGCIYDYETFEVQLCNIVAGNTLTFTDLEPGEYWVALDTAGETGYTPGFGVYLPKVVDPVQIVLGQVTELQVDLIAPGQVTFFVSGPGADTARACIFGPGTDTCKDVIDGVAVYSSIPAGSWHYDVLDADYNPLASGDYELASGQNLEIDVELPGEPIDLSIDVNVRTSDGGPVPSTTQVCILDDEGNEFECQPATQSYPDPATVHFDQVPSNPFRVITTGADGYRNVDELVPFTDGEGSFQVDVVLQKLGGEIFASVDSANPAPGSNVMFLTTVAAQLSAEASPWIVTSDAPFAVFGVSCAPAPNSGSCQTGSDSDPEVILSPNPSTGRFYIEVYFTYVVPNTPGVSYTVTFCAGPTNNPSNRICASDSFTVAGSDMPSTPTPTPDYHPSPPANPGHGGLPNHGATSSSSSATVSGLPNTGAESASSPRGYAALLLSAMLLLLAGFCLARSPRWRVRR